jgi:hypothetical protein
MPQRKDTSFVYLAVPMEWRLRSVLNLHTTGNKRSEEKFDFERWLHGFRNQKCPRT